MEWEDVIKNSKSKSDACRLMGIPINGSGIRKVDNAISDLNLNIDHFEIGFNKRKYKRIEKNCPVCYASFTTMEGSPKEKITCSTSCANTYFRTGVDHGSWGGNNYRNICFNKSKRECIVCGENKMVDVHHYDHDRGNNNIENLIPLCPTHHAYMHSKFKHEYIHIVEDFRTEILNNFG